MKELDWEWVEGNLGSDESREDIKLALLGLVTPA